MVPTALDDAYKLKVNLRPAKFAYFFHEEDADALTQILRFVCTQWGGLRTILVPVQRDGSIHSFFAHLLRLADPDGFVGDFNGWNRNPPGIHQGTLASLQALFPGRTLHLQQMRWFREFDPAPHPIHVLTDEDRQSKSLGRYTLDNDFGKPWLGLALFGSIYPGQEEAYDENLTIADREVAVTSSAFWESQYVDDPFGSVLNLTAYGMRPHKVVGSTRTNSFNLVLVESPLDLCYYWNLRSLRESTQFDRDLGRRTFLVPAELLADRACIRSLGRFIQQNILYPNLHADVHIIATAWSDEKEDQLAAALGKCRLFKRHPKGAKASDHSWSGPKPPQNVDLDVSKLIYAPSVPRLPYEYYEGIEPQVAHRVELTLGTNEVLLQPPPSFRNRGYAGVGVDIECDVWSRYPKAQAVGNAIDQQARFSKYGLTNIRHVPETATYLAISLLDEWESLRQYFQARGYQTQLSKDGQYADALVTLLGGMPRVDLLASKEAYLLLDLLALRSTKKIAQRVAQQFGLKQEQLPDIQRVLEDVEVISELKGVTKTYRQLSQRQELQPYKGKLLGLMDELTRASVLVRGFYLHCPRCGAPDWHPLEAVKERVQCTGCGHESPLPVEQPKGSEIQWEYRLNTLVNRAMDQDVLPNLLALHHLTKGRKCSCLTTGLSLTKEAKEKELDFLFCFEQQLYAGECKAGTGLEEKDMVTARLAAELGIVKFYFATTAKFGDEAVKLVEQLRTDLKQEGVEMEVAMLSETELLNVPPASPADAPRVPPRFPPPTASVGTNMVPPTGL